MRPPLEFGLRSKFGDRRRLLRTSGCDVRCTWGKVLSFSDPPMIKLSTRRYCFMDRDVQKESRVAPGRIAACSTASPGRYTSPSRSNSSRKSTCSARDFGVEESLPERHLPHSCARKATIRMPRIDLRVRIISGRSDARIRKSTSDQHCRQETPHSFLKKQKCTPSPSTPETVWKNSRQRHNWRLRRRSWHIPRRTYVAYLLLASSHGPLTGN